MISTTESTHRFRGRWILCRPTVLHLFAGLGGGALGFKRAGFRSVGAFDLDEACCTDFDYLVGEQATKADLGTITPDELRASCTGRPDVVFSSPPCVAFSGCLPAATAATKPYQELSNLALRGIWLALDAWPERPPSLIVLENVPRILSRGRKWLDQLTGLLWSYGYTVRETTHDCGELGGLAQHRRRFLLVARHMEQVPEFLYEPPIQRVKGVGEVLGEIPVPLPGLTVGGPMHRLPMMSPMNWLRLALIPAGGDWRDLPEAIALPARPNRHNGPWGINRWDHGSHTVVAEGTPRNTWASVADPRVTCSPRSGVYGVVYYDQPSPSVIAASRPDNGSYSVADPRVTCERRAGSMGVTGWDEASVTVIANGSPQNGPWQVADPRLKHEPRRDSYGVLGWAEASHCIRAVQKPQNTSDAVADPRIDIEIDGAELDLDSRKPCHLVIRAIDGTWHRPMTTLELAALQGFPVQIDGDWLHLSGRSHKSWRQRIGNAVPPPSAEAIARECRATLEASQGGRLLLSGQPVWVEEVQPC